MQNIILEEQEYKLFKDYREGYDSEALKERFTDYFLPYDYVLGDWSYGKLRLKGFYKKEHKDCRALNNFEGIENHLKKNCAFDCRYFIIEKSN